MKRVISLLVLAAFSAAAGAADYVVDCSNPAAADTNDGSAGKPFKTIGKAMQVAAAGDVVTIGEGVYRESMSFVKGGEKGKPVTFQAKKPGTVIVDGSDLLKGWTKDEGDKPCYSVPWAYDFSIQRNKDGSLKRFNGLQIPGGCAEQVIWDGRPLRMVAKYEGLSESTFFVDWDKDLLTVWLPGGVDPSKTEVYGCVRQRLLGANDKEKAAYVTVKGLTFRYAANFAQRGAVAPVKGWTLEDVVVEWCSAGAVTVQGDDVTLTRVSALHNGQMGIGGSSCKNTYVKDCVSAYNNHRGFSPSWEAGGGKFLRTDGLRVEGWVGHHNGGPGLWLDWANKNYRLTGNTCYANFGIRADWEGTGIMSECNEGPGVISDNICYSNTGMGIVNAESEELVIENNLLVDNGTGICLRAMEDRKDSHHKDGVHLLRGLTIRGNRFKDNKVAIESSLGTWDRDAVAQKKIAIDGNVYDVGGNGVFIAIDKQKAKTLADVRQMFSFEKTGKQAKIAFDKPLEKVKTVAKVKENSIPQSLSGKNARETAVIGANGRTSFKKEGNGYSTQVFDLANNFLTLDVPSEALRNRIEQALLTYPVTDPVMIEVKVQSTEAGKLRATAIGLK